MPSNRKDPLLRIPPTLVGYGDLNVALDAGFSTQEVTYMFDLDADPIVEGVGPAPKSEPATEGAARVDTPVSKAYKPNVA